MKKIGKYNTNKFTNEKNRQIQYKQIYKCIKNWQIQYKQIYKWKKIGK